MSKFDVDYTISEIKMTVSLWEQVGWRFVSAGLYSALSTVVTVTYFTGVTTWEQFGTAISALSLSILIGFITGVLMAAHKYFTGATVSTTTSLLE